MKTEEEEASKKDKERPQEKPEEVSFEEMFYGPAHRLA